jgi:hypothetical protein
MIRYTYFPPIRAMLKPAFLKIEKNTMQQDFEIWFAHKDKLTFK